MLMDGDDAVTVDGQDRASGRWAKLYVIAEDEQDQEGDDDAEEKSAPAVAARADWRSSP